ncbi:ATP-binding protein [Methyloterricola oryzae]|uniref:ATP-binding protein n=1 Tax=Methyloterricola oryzae TaxID=1495050 RepID=UPI001F47F2D3|nr:ATP-binding protein [Methyloterricola oryzae]
MSTPRSEQDIAAELQQCIPVLREIPTNILGEVARGGKHQATPSGTVLFREGDSGDHWYCILAGDIRVHAKGNTEIDREITVFHAGDTFGELALLDGNPRSATATCISPCRLFLVPQEVFLLLLGSSPAMLTVMLRRLVTKIRYDTEQILETELEKEHIRAEQEAARRRAMSQLVAGVAHEINTPLGIANQAASLIGEILHAPGAPPVLDKSAIEDLRDASQLILTNIERASRLITTFKSLSVAQARDVREKVSLRKLVEDTVELFSLKGRSKQLQIALEDRLGAGMSDWVGYPAILSQIVLNLLTNVERYAYPSGKPGPVEIILNGSSDGDTFSVIVRDYGQGIDPNHLSQIFEPFFTTGRHQGGTGLGLSIVKNLVTESLGGGITIDSQPGEGTTVRMTLPRCVASHAEV